MEAYSSSVNMSPVAVGGLVGQICPPERGWLVGGCTGLVRLDRAGARYVGGCVGRVVPLGFQQFVGGCVGRAAIGAVHVERRSYPHDRVRHAQVKLREEALAAAQA